MNVPENYCGPCYGAKGQGECCNTCDDIQDAYSELGWNADLDSFEQVRNNERGKSRLILMFFFFFFWKKK